MENVSNVAAITVVTTVGGTPDAAMYAVFESYVNLFENAGVQAELDAAAAADSAADAVAAQLLAEQAANQAVGAVDALNPSYYYDTYADANAAIGSLNEGDVVEIFVDETKYLKRTRYRLESGVLVFKIILLTEHSAMLSLAGVIQDDYFILNGERRIGVDLTLPVGVTLTIEDGGVLAVL